MTVDLSNDPHILALRAVLVAENEASIAHAQERADAARVAGREWFQRFWQEHADWQRARPYPWEKDKSVAEPSQERPGAA